MADRRPLGPEAGDPFWKRHQHPHHGDQRKPLECEQRVGEAPGRAFADGIEFAHEGRQAGGGQRLLADEEEAEDHTLEGHHVAGVVDRGGQIARHGPGLDKTGQFEEQVGDADREAGPHDTLGQGLSRGRSGHWRIQIFSGVCAWPKCSMVRSSR